MGLTMNDIAFLVGITGLCVFYAAWYEHRRDNKRDAALLASVGMGTLVLAVSAAFT